LEANSATEQASVARGRKGLDGGKK